MFSANWGVFRIMTGAGYETSDMPRLEKPRRTNATLCRRGLLAAGGATLLAACGSGEPLTASVTPRLRMDRLNEEMAELARRARPGALGVGLMNLESGEAFTLAGDRRFPMQSVFKMLLGAAVLSEADAGRLPLDERHSLTEEQLSPPYSPIAEAWPARRDYTARELLTAAVSVSDNTAADVLMKRIGGPGAVDAWLQARRIEEIRVDRYERQLQTEAHGLPSFRPSWRTEAAFSTALAARPQTARMSAMRAYLADPRDTATPRGMLEFLSRLNANELLSPMSTLLLLQLMTDTPTGARRLKAGLPDGAILAHKTGTARTDLGLNVAINDVGIFTLPDKRSYALAVFLAGSTLDRAAREAIFADAARIAVRGVG